MIPKISIFFIFVLMIPVFQYLLNKIYFFDKMFLSVIYLFSFWLAIIVGFNSGKNGVKIFFGLILILGVISSCIAIIQWLDIKFSIDWIMAAQGRPFANMAQPNHLSTFLILSLISCLYFYENNNINKKLLFIFSLLIFFSIALTQSRTSWVVLFFLYLYFIASNRKKILTIRLRDQTLFLIFFILCSLYLPIIKASLWGKDGVSIIDRVSSGHERIQIWQQAIDAIQRKPIWGYGWNQSSFAQYETIQSGYVKKWLTSFHNIILDIIIWCGIPIGIVLISFFLYIVIRYLVKSFDINQICSICSICAILIHALFEFPLSYSYFLLPLGFLLGFLFFCFDSGGLRVNNLFSILIFVIGIAISGLLFKDYSHIPDNMVAAEAHELNKIKKDIDLPFNSVFFETFDYRARWISFYPCEMVSKKQLEGMENMVKTYFIYYDLYKYAEVAAYNKNFNEARKAISILNYMYNKNNTINSLKCISD